MVHERAIVRSKVFDPGLAIDNRDVFRDEIHARDHALVLRASGRAGEKFSENTGDLGPASRHIPAWIDHHGVFGETRDDGYDVAAVPRTIVRRLHRTNRGIIAGSIGRRLIHLLPSVQRTGVQPRAPGDATASSAGLMTHTRRMGRSRSSSEAGSPTDASDAKDGVSSI
jgi:hypothetical protein